MMISIEEEFQQLRGGLYKPLLFFVPAKIIPEGALKFVDKEVQNQFLDTLVLIKEDGAGYKIKNEPVLYNILQKKSNLDTSVFKIFEIKEHLKPEQFDFFIQRYLTEVDAYLFITEWLYENRALCKESQSDEVSQSLAYQFECLKQHLEDLNKHCLIVEQPIKKESKSILDFIENSIPELKALLTENNPSSKIKEQLPSPVSELKETGKKKIKPTRITEQEAGDYLLETVFNIQLKKRIK